MIGLGMHAYLNLCSHLPAFVQTTRAAITPGTHPHKVNRVTINIVPQPMSNTAKGGRRMQINALPNPIFFSPSRFKAIAREIIQTVS
jgi:hypothetical protein